MQHNGQNGHANGLQQLSHADLDALALRLSQEKNRRQQHQMEAMHGIQPQKPMPTPQQFIAEHSREGPPLPVKNRDGDSSGLKLLPTGAQVYTSGLAFSCAPPPHDHVENLQARLRYWTLAVEVTERDFEQLSHALEGRGYFNWPLDNRYGQAPGGGRDGELQAKLIIKAAVDKSRLKVMQITAELEKCPEIQKQRQEEEAAARQHQEIERLRQQQDFERQRQLASVTI